MRLFNSRSLVDTIANKVFGKTHTGVETVDTSENGFSLQAVPKGGEVVIRADPDNTDYVYVGGNNESTSDFKLLAGDSVSLAESDVSNIQGRANSGTQKIYWITEGE